MAERITRRGFIELAATVTATAVVEEVIRPGKASATGAGGSEAPIVHPDDEAEIIANRHAVPLPPGVVAAVLPPENDIMAVAQKDPPSISEAIKQLGMFPIQGGCWSGITKIGADDDDVHIHPLSSEMLERLKDAKNGGVSTIGVQRLPLPSGLSLVYLEGLGRGMGYQAVASGIGIDDEFHDLRMGEIISAEALSLGGGEPVVVVETRIPQGPFKPYALAVVFPDRQDGDGDGVLHKVIDTKTSSSPKLVAVQGPDGVVSAAYWQSSRIPVHRPRVLTVQKLPVDQVDLSVRDIPGPEKIIQQTGIPKDYGRSSAPGHYAPFAVVPRDNEQLRVFFPIELIDRYDTRISHIMAIDLAGDGAMSRQVFYRLPDWMNVWSIDGLYPRTDENGISLGVVAAGDNGSRGIAVVTDSGARTILDPWRDGSVVNANNSSVIYDQLNGGRFLVSNPFGS